MATIITNPSAGDLSPVDKFHVVEGGTGAQTAPEALSNLGGIDRGMKGIANGPVPLDAERMIPANYLSDYNPTTLGINGPLIVQCGTVAVFQLINYDSYETYVGEATVGEVEIHDDNHVLYMVPQQAGPCGFSVNGRSIALTAVEGMITRPEVLSPAENAAVGGVVLTIQGSIFECVDTGPVIETFSSADCELSLYPDFSTILDGIYGNPNTTFVFQNPITEYGPYIRIRYHGTTRTSEWSPNRHLIPAEKLVLAPTITYPVEGNTGGVPDATDQIRRYVVADIALSAFVAENYIDSFLSADYQVSRFADFHDVYVSTYNNAGAERTWRATNLYYSTLYYVRAKHRGTERESAWSNVLQFLTVADARYIEKPAVVSSVVDPTKSILTYDFTATPHTPVNYQGTLGLSYWEVATDEAFSNLAYHGSFTGAVTSSIQLNFNTTYYVRVYYFDNFKQSVWSDTYTLTTAVDDRIVVAPSILSPANNANISGSTTYAQASLFQTSSSLTTFSDSHVSSDWELSTDATFSTLVNSVYGSTSELQYWDTGPLTYGMRYFVRTRQHGNVKTSNWSEPAIFYTSATTTATLDIVGAGGGGGGGGHYFIYDGGGGGGGGGAGTLITQTTQFLLGQTFTVNVASGGNGGSNVADVNNGTGLSGAAGGVSTVTGNGVAISAAGGTGGGGGRSASAIQGNGAGGTGGSFAGSNGRSGAAATEGSVAGGAGGTGGTGGKGSSTLYGIAGTGGVEHLSGNAGGIGSGGGGGGGGSPINGRTAGTGGKGGSGVVVFEYPATMAQLVTTGAVYSLVNGKHRYVWSTAGSYQFVIPDNRTIQTPTLAIQGGTVNTPRIPVLNGSTFTPVNYTDTHASSSWQIATDANFANVVASSTNDTTNKTSWTPNVGLAAATTYYGRVRYNGSQRSSDWSAGVQFTTQPPPLPAPVISSVSIDMPSSIGIDMYSISDGGVDRNAAWYIDLSFVIDGATVRTISNIPASWTGYTNGNVSDSLGSYAITTTVKPFNTYSVLLRADISLQYGNSSNPNVFLGATSVTMSMRLKTSTGSVSPWTVPINCNIVYPDVPVAGG